MADPFVIYTLGETGLFSSALNGVAMLFHDTALLHGDGVGNLGFGAFFGMMLLFVVWVYNAAFKQQMDMKALLAPLIVYMVLTVPKTSVAIEDVYSGTVRSVDNIPIGLALPAAVASGISVLFTEIIEKAYQVVGGYPSGYMPKISEDGFVTPLKLINALRDSASIVPSQSMLQTTKNIYQACISTNPDFNPSKYKEDADPVKYFTDAAKLNTNTVVYVTMATTGSTVSNVMSCKDAATELQRAMDAYIDGINNSASGPTKINPIIGDVTLYNLRSAMIRQMTANGETNGFNPKPAAGGTTYSINDIVDYVSLMGNTSQSNARSFMMATIFNPMLESASYCLEKGDGMTGMSKCSAWISSRSQWEEKNAAAATGFLQVMRDGQNVLIMLSFLLFPIIVLFVMIQGTSSFKLLGNYMAFTVAAYLWLPMAAIINFYTQTTLSDEWLKVANATGISTLNLITGPQFYAAVSQKLSLANALLASVPVLSMMLFSGMMMGMNQIYSRMNSADAGNYDSKVNTPDISKSAPLATTNSAVNISGMGVANAVGQQQTSFSSSNMQKTGTEWAKSLNSSKSEIESDLTAVENSIKADISNSKTFGKSTGDSDTFAKANAITNGSVTQKGDTHSTQSGHTKTTDSSNVNSKQDVSATGASANASANAGVNGRQVFGGPNKDKDKGNQNQAGSDKDKKDSNRALTLQANAQIGGQVQGSTSDVTSNGQALSTSDAATLSTNDGKFKSTAATNSNSINTSSTSANFEQRLNELRNAASVSKGGGFDQKYANDFSRIQAKIDSLKHTEQQSMEFGKSISADAPQAAGMINRQRDRFEDFKSSVASINDPKFEQELKRQEDSLTQLPIESQRKDVAMLAAALQSDNAEIRNKARDFFDPQGASKYNEISQSVGDIKLNDVSDLVDQKTAHAQSQLAAAHERTGLEINPNSLPSASSIVAPYSNKTTQPKHVNPNMVSVDPKQYNEDVADANNSVANGVRHLVTANPKGN